MKLRSSKSGIGLVEVALATLVVALVGLPVLSNVSTAVRQTAASEDYMFAETLAVQHLEQALATPLSELKHDLPQMTPIPSLSDKDRERTRSLKSFQSHIEGTETFHGQLVIDELDEDLFRYTVTVEWPVQPGSTAQRRLVLVRLRCPNELGLKFRAHVEEAPSKQALEAAKE